MRTVLNPAPAAPNLDLAHVRDVSYLVPNETELAILTGMPTETEPDIEAAARSLLGQGLRAVIVTLGSRGALLAGSGTALAGGAGAADDGSAGRGDAAAVGLAAVVGAAASLSRLSEPSGSSHATSLTPVSDSDST